MKSDTVNRKAVELFNKPHVAARYEALQEARSKRTGINADYVLNQAVKIHERVMQEVTPETYADGTQITDEEGNPIYGFDAKAAVSSLKLIGDHVGVQAFKKQVEVEVGVKKSLAELLQQAVADDSK
jgi:phage terminase small subunit